MRTRTLVTMILAGLLCATAAQGQQKLTYVDLVKRLTDLERLAELPEPGEKCVQWSSYDRRSKYDATSGKYVGWSANGDGTGRIRVEDGMEVFAEMEGPGVIWRIWSALAGKGRVKIFLDGSATPAVDQPFVKYFDCSTKPFNYPTLCYTAARGRNCFVPIGFQKSCKIVAEKGWGRYYQFTYTIYPKGTQLPTFRLPLTADEELALAKVDEFFRTGFGTDPAGQRAGEKEVVFQSVIQPGKSATVLALEGPRAITAIRGSAELEDDRDEEIAALRELVLKITWDDDKTPSVWTPVGDFFGTAPGVNDYRSFPLGLTREEGAYSFWYMPFGKAAKIEIVNGGTVARTVDCQVTHAPLTRPIGKLGRFHAKWHRDAFLPAEPERRAIDWTMLKTTGRGRFCGVMLNVWNPRGGWWGEGDEKFFVDGEKFPSTIGTGSEDYFGYAWCNPTLFQRAYHNQTISMGNRGHISVNRFQIPDNVPFQKSFEAAIEKYYPNRKPTLYAAIAYWYQAPGGEDPYEPVPPAERLGWYVQPKVFHVKGALEGEKLKVISKTAGEARPQDLGSFPLGKWSGESHLWWTGAKPGDKLTLALPVAEAGRYELKGLLTKAIDYGIVQLSLDGAKLGDPIDLYNDGVIPTKLLSFGTHDLTAGRHELTVEITGANEKAKKAYMFGLDYVLLAPAK